MNAAYAWPRCRVGPLTTTALVAAVPAENSLSTKIGPGAKAKSEPAVMDRRAPQVYQKRLSPDPDLDAINTRIHRRCGTGRRTTNGK